MEGRVMKPLENAPLVYLGGPYTGMEQESFDRLTAYAGILKNKGYLVFSPITHCHPIAQVCKLPGDFEYWKAYNRRMLEPCDILIILKLPTWDSSTGVTGSLEWLESLEFL